MLRYNIKKQFILSYKKRLINIILKLGIDYDSWNLIIREFEVSFQFEN